MTDTALMIPEPAGLPGAPGFDSVEKAAIVLAALGPDRAGPFLAGMSEANLKRFAHAISRLRRVPKERLETVIEEFLDALGTDEDVQGGTREARRILGKALDASSVTRIMSEVEGTGNLNIWEKLSDSSDQALAAFLQKEHPQTAAVILTELRPDKAAAVLERMEREVAQQTVLRLSRVPSLDKEILHSIQVVIERDFLSALRRELATRKPAELIGGLMNGVSGEARDHFLKHLEEVKPALAAEVLKVMFTFDDVAARVQPRDVPIILKAVEEETLMIALKLGAQDSSPTYDFLLGNISKRLSERYNEDVGGMPDVRRREGETAQAEIVRVIQAMVKRGEIKLIVEDAAD